MNLLTVYTDIDTIFDTRRGILEHMAKEANAKNFRWKEYQTFYKDRNIDYFEKPEWGITYQGYLDRFAKRSVDDWVDDTHCYFYPSGVIPGMLPIIRSTEFGAQQSIQIADIALTINTYPFKLSDELQEQLISHIRGGFRIPIEVVLTYVPFDKQTANYINKFNYVFRYGHLINPEMKTWFDTYPDCMLAGTKIIVPALLAKLPSNDPLLDTLNKDSAKNRIEKISALQAGKVIFIPLDKSLFDFYDD